MIKKEDIIITKENSSYNTSIFKATLKMVAQTSMFNYDNNDGSNTTTGAIDHDKIIEDRLTSEIMKMIYGDIKLNLYQILDKIAYLQRANANGETGKVDEVANYISQKIRKLRNDIA